MFIPRIYYPHPISSGELITLDKTISHYLMNVLRLKNNEDIIIFNGQGGEYAAKFQADKKLAKVHVLSFNDTPRESPLNLILGQSLVRGDRMDLVIQKATELGVTAIYPLISHYSTVKLDNERSQKRLEHWQNIAISAAEQCGRTKLPILHPPCLLKDWVKQPFTGSSVIFEIGSTVSLKNITPASSIRLAIGPESGWEAKEVSLMNENGFTACSLGTRILRTETAAIAAVSTLQALYGDLG